jgi:hypothetical protein
VTISNRGDFIGEITRKQRERLCPGLLMNDGSVDELPRQEAPDVPVNHSLAAWIFGLGSASVSVALFVIAHQSRSLLILILLIAWIAIVGMVVSSLLRKAEA